MSNIVDGFPGRSSVYRNCIAAGEYGGISERVPHVIVILSLGYGSTAIESDRIQYPSIEDILYVHS